MSQQGIVGRVMQLARANVNAVIDSAEDPQKMRDQLVTDYGAHISAAEQAIAQTIANLRMIEEDQKEEAKAAQQWGKKALAASNKADELRAASHDKKEADTFDDLARVALERQMTAESDVATVQHTINAQNESVDKLKAGVDQMKVKLHDLKRKRDKLVARSRSGKAQSRLPETVQGIDIMDPTSEVSWFEAKVRREEARVRGKEKLASSSLDAQFASLDDLDNKTEIESRLKVLKAGRSAASRSAASRSAASRSAARRSAAARTGSRRRASLH